MTSGGRLGYSSVNSSVSLKVPIRFVRKSFFWFQGEGRGRKLLPPTPPLLSILAPPVSLLFPLFTSIPRRVLGPEDHGLPAQDVVRGGRAVDALRRVLLQTAKVPHQTLRFFGFLFMFFDGGFVSRVRPFFSFSVSTDKLHGAF